MVRTLAIGVYVLLKLSFKESITLSNYLKVNDYSSEASWILNWLYGIFYFLRDLNEEKY